MDWYWKDFWRGATVGIVAGVVAGVTQLGIGTPPLWAVVGGAIVFVVVAALAPFIRRWKNGRASSES